MVFKLKESNSAFLYRPKDGRPASAVYSSKGIGEPAILFGSSGVYSAIRDAVAAYRAQNGNTDWFDLGVPATADKIRMAATDELSKFVDSKIKMAPMNEREAFQV